MTDARTPVPLATLLEHRDFVRALARSLVADASRADDLEQQVWADTVRRPPSEDRGVRAWLARVVRRRARDQRRGERRFETAAARAAFERTAPAADEVVAQAEVAERLVRLVLSLDEPYRTTVLLRFYEDLTPEVVAARMDTSVETVRTRTRRGLERLRQRLGGDDPRSRERWVAGLAALAAGDGGGPSPAGRGPAGGVATAATLGGGAVMAGGTMALVAAVAGLGAGGVLGWAIRGEPPAPAGPAIGERAAVGPDSHGVRAAASRAAPPSEAAPSPTPGPATAAAPAPPPAPVVKPIRGRVVTVSGEHVAGALVWAVARDGAPLGSDASLELRNAGFAGYAPTLRRVGLVAAIETKTAQDGTFEIACRENSPHAVWVFPANAQVRSPTDFAADSVGPGDTVEFVVLPTGADQLRARMLDPRLPAKDRIEAFSKLERRGSLDEESIRAVIELLRTSAEARDRATILRELHRKKSPLLVEPLLTSLRDDADESVREEAAETLDDYLAEPRVVEALKAAATGDPSRKVREQAAESLEGGERKGR